MTEFGGYANAESFAFEIWTANNQDLYNAILDYARDCLRRVPNMTEQTLGVNIVMAVETWVNDSRNGLPIVNYGWGPQAVCKICSERVRYMGAYWDHAHSRQIECGTGDGSTAYPADLPISRKILSEMAADVGDFSKIDRTEVGETWRETVKGE